MATAPKTPTPRQPNRSSAILPRADPTDMPTNIVPSNKALSRLRAVGLNLAPDGSPRVRRLRP